MMSALTSLPRAHRAGFSLVEVLVVLAIIAGLVGGSVYGIGMLSAGDLKSNALRLTSSIKYMYSQAAVHNTQYRLVFDLDTGTYEAQVVAQAFVEEGPQDEEAAEARRARDEEFLTEEALALGEEKAREKELFDDREDNPFGFNRSVSARRIQDSVISPGVLDKGVRFERIIVPNLPEAEDGKVALNFFPNGYQEPIIIILSDKGGENKFSLVTEPLTGRVKLYSKEVEVPKDFGQGESDD